VVGDGPSELMIAVLAVRLLRRPPLSGRFANRGRRVDEHSSDGAYGELTRVVVDPVRRTLTHLLVEARHRQGNGRLVPIDLVRSAEAEIMLGCTTAQFNALEGSLPGASGEWDYQHSRYSR
jgi:hypothetical protein